MANSKHVKHAKTCHKHAKVHANVYSGKNTYQSQHHCIPRGRWMLATGGSGRAGKGAYTQEEPRRWSTESPRSCGSTSRLTDTIGSFSPPLVEARGWSRSPHLRHIQPCASSTCYRGSASRSLMPSGMGTTHWRKRCAEVDQTVCSEVTKDVLKVFRRLAAECQGFADRLVQAGVMVELSPRQIF